MRSFRKSDKLVGLFSISATPPTASQSASCMRALHGVRKLGCERHGLAHEDNAVIYDIRGDKTYHMGDGLPEHIMVGGFHPRPFDLYEGNRDGGCWDGNWFEIPTALDQVCLQTLQWCTAAASLCRTSWFGQCIFHICSRDAASA